MFVKNKVALVTGGATGIGLCYAIELLKNGLRAVTLADQDAVSGEEAVTKLTEEFGADKVLFVQTDVTQKEQIKHAFEKTVEQYQNVDILINNAGIMNESIWEKEISINLVGTIYGCLSAMEDYIPKYKTGEEGVIVNISSIAGLTIYPAVPFYTATKYGIIGLSRSLGTPDHYGSCKVRVLTVCPGVTDTPLMANLKEKMVNERYLDVLKIGFQTRLTPSQSPEDVAKGLIKAIEEGSNGSIWVAEAGETYEIDIPERQELKKK